MKAYLDASVLAARAIGEPSSSAIIRWTMRLGPSSVPSFSDFGRGEAASALGLRVRTQFFKAPDALSALLALDAELAGYEKIGIKSEDIELARAFVLDFELGLRLPDAIHIAIARRVGATLVSLDKGQLAGARSLGIAAVDPLA